MQWDDSKLGDLQSGNLQEDLQLENSQLEACGIDNTTLQEKFSSILKKAEEQILESMCIFMCLSVVISLYIHQEGNMRRILEEGSFFFAVFMIVSLLISNHPIANLLVNCPWHVSRLLFLYFP